MSKRSLEDGDGEADKKLQYGQRRAKDEWNVEMGEFEDPWEDEFEEEDEDEVTFNAENEDDLDEEDDEDDDNGAPMD
jgi:ribosome assembly protein RRB1